MENIDPILNIRSLNGTNCYFRISNCNISLANALRRTIISDIPNVVFKTDEKYNGVFYKFDINTTRYNNEFLKQRLSCIPINLNIDDKFDNLEFHVDLTNNTDSILDVTTENFSIYDTITENYIDKTIVHKILPPNSITQDFILFAKINDDISGEKLKFMIKPQIGTAKENGCFNVVSTSTYLMTPDEARQKYEWEKIQDNLSLNTDTDIDIENEKINWYNLEAKRITIPNSYDFHVETIGILHPQNIIRDACSILIEKISNYIQIVNNNNLQINDSESTMEYCYDIIFDNNMTTTLGKVFEYIGYSLFYENNNIISFICYKKIHPHDNHSILRLTFNIDKITQETENLDEFMKTFINDRFLDICHKSISLFDKIYSQITI